MNATRSRTVTIATGARLHFGLLDTVAPFGGVGWMIDAPSTVVRIESSTRFEISGPAADRVRVVAERFAALFGLRHPPACHVQILDRPAPHVGLGTGTQLALAVSEGLCQWTERPYRPMELATRIADRGKRSAVGIHGYWHGGLIYEHADVPTRHTVNPLAMRVELPASWRVVLLRPSGLTSRVAGQEEQNRFASLDGATDAQRSHLRTRIEQEILPAAIADDFAGFSEAIYRYNRDSGALFAAVQGGCYNGEQITRVVETLRAADVAGVGQSSWGPLVFALAETQEMVDHITAVATGHGWSLEAVAGPKNDGRSLHVGE